MITILEDLPDEILINILEYIASPAIIYCSFNKLNARFDQILQSIRLNLDVFMEDKQSLIIVRYFSLYCNRLRVDNICPSISLEKFLYLRSLTLIEPTDLQINSIQPRTLPLLEYLSCPASMSIFDCLFANDHQQWLYLHSCNFYFSHFPSPKLSWQINSKLCILSGIICSRIRLSQLLSLLPCLKHLRVDMISNDLSNWNLRLIQKTLLSLRIGFYQLNYDDLSVLIGSNLCRLYIDIHHEQPSINFNYLATLIISLTTKLKQFNCDYRGLNVSLDDIQRTHKLFRNIQLIESYSDDIIRLSCRDMI